MKEKLTTTNKKMIVLTDKQMVKIKGGGGDRLPIPPG